MMEIEPHPNLINYFEITSEFRTSLTVDYFFNKGEHYNIVSNVENNIYLLKRLDKIGLLSNHNSICDAGLGLGNALFDLYLQSLDIQKSFSFTGIEKNDEYISFINEKLTHLWENRLNLIHDDIMSHDYSLHNIVYTYSPFSDPILLRKLYEKISEEILPGSIIVEHANSGLGHAGILESITNLNKIDVDHVVIFVRT
jgi:hypothetical protein